MHREGQLDRQGIPIGKGACAHMTSAHLSNRENVRFSEGSQQRRSNIESLGDKRGSSKVIILNKLATHSHRNIQKAKSMYSSSLLVNHPISKYALPTNLYGDETWIYRQQQLFTPILNEVLESHNSRSNVRGTTLLENFRKAAFDYYHSDKFQTIVRPLNFVPSNSDIIANRSKAFKTKKFKLISEPYCFRDLGIRAEVKELLCHSYTPSWLALGMELVTGRTYGPIELTHEDQGSLLSFIDNVWRYL
jgi:hypothetical protein